MLLDPPSFLFFFFPFPSWCYHPEVQWSFQKKTLGMYCFFDYFISTKWRQVTNILVTSLGYVFGAQNITFTWNNYFIALFSKETVITKMKHFMRKGFQSNGHKGNVWEAWQLAQTLPAGFVILEYFQSI